MICLSTPLPWTLDTASGSSGETPGEVRDETTVEEIVLQVVSQVVDLVVQATPDNSAVRFTIADEFDSSLVEMPVNLLPSSLAESIQHLTVYQSELRHNLAHLRSVQTSYDLDFARRAETVRRADRAALSSTPLTAHQGRVTSCLLAVMSYSKNWVWNKPVCQRKGGPLSCRTSKRKNWQVLPRLLFGRALLTSRSKS